MTNNYEILNKLFKEIEDCDWPLEGNRYFTISDVMTDDQWESEFNNHVTKVTVNVIDSMMRREGLQHPPGPLDRFRFIVNNYCY